VPSVDVAERARRRAWALGLMSYWRRLVVVELRVLTVLALVSGVVAAVAGVTYLSIPDMRSSAAALSVLFFSTALLIGAVVV
jgi:hypothetical protein